MIWIELGEDRLVALGVVVREKGSTMMLGAAL